MRDELPRLFEADSLALIHLRRGAYEGATCGAYRAATAIVLLPWLVVAPLAVIALARRRGEPVVILLGGVVALYSLLHVATHGFSRYRLPILPAFLLLAASLSHRPWDGEPLPRRARILAVVLIAAFVAVSGPSILDQLGHLGVASPPSHEGFRPLCP
jgi:hypothetical protein